MEFFDRRTPERTPEEQAALNRSRVEQALSSAFRRTDEARALRYTGRRKPTFVVTSAEAPPIGSGDRTPITADSDPKLYAAYEAWKKRLGRSN